MLLLLLLLLSRGLSASRLAGQSVGPSVKILYFCIIEHYCPCQLAHLNGPGLQLLKHRGLTELTLGPMLHSSNLRSPSNWPCKVRYSTFAQTFLTSSTQHGSASSSLPHALRPFG